jgi:hypothetical protein
MVNNACGVRKRLGQITRLSDYKLFESLLTYTLSISLLPIANIHAKDDNLYRFDQVKGDPTLRIAFEGPQR